MKKQEYIVIMNSFVKPLVNLYQEQGSVPGTMWTKTPSDSYTDKQNKYTNSTRA